MPGGFSSGFSAGFSGGGTGSPPPAPPPPAVVEAGVLNFLVEIAFSSQANPDAWSLGVTPFPAILGDPLIEDWTDVTADCVAISSTRGKAKELDAYGAGSLVLTFRNVERKFDPLNLFGPYVFGGETLIKPGKPVRVRVTDPLDNTVYPVFRGTIRDWPLDYGANYEAYARAVARDILAELPVRSVSILTDAGQSGQAVQSILTQIGAAAGTVDAGNAAVQQMLFTGTAAQALRVLEQTEQGHLFAEPDGGLTFRERLSTTLAERSQNVQATFGGTTGLPYEGPPGVDYSSDVIRNHAKVTRLGGVPIAAVNQDSIDKYGERLITLTGLACASDAEAGALADYLVSFRGEPTVRFTELVMAPEENSGTLTAAFALRILDRVQVYFWPPGASGPISQDVFVIGISHNWSPPRPMKTTFRFMPTDFIPLGVWYLGLGQLGVSTGSNSTVLV